VLYGPLLKQRLIPLLLKDAELPPFLATRVYVDFRDADGPDYRDRVTELIRRLKNEPLPPPSLTDQLRGGAILAKWETMGKENSPLGAPRSPEAAGEGSARYATFDKGAVYWSPESGAEPLTGAIYEAWASLGYERGALGLPTSGEIQEPQWIVQNFQHGTLNLDRENGTVTRVIDGVPEELPPPSADGPPVQLERIKPIDPS